MKSARQVHSLKAFLFWNDYPLNYMHCLQTLLETRFLSLFLYFLTSLGPYIGWCKSS